MDNSKEQPKKPLPENQEEVGTCVYLDPMSGIARTIAATKRECDALAGTWTG